MNAPQQQHYRTENPGQRSEDRSRDERSQRNEVNPAKNPRYSYMDSPDELDVPLFFSSADPRSQTSRSENLPTKPQAPPHSPYPVEKASIDPTLSPYNFPPPQETHPAHLAPYANPAPFPDTYNALRSSQAPPPSSQIPSRGQLVSPTLVSTIADNTDEAATGAGMLAETGPNTRESQWSLPQAMHAPIYNPDSLSGPNGVAAANHQPGQSVHPNMELNNGQWRHGLCGCETSICALGICCPCMLYGKTEYRLSRRAAKKDPTDLLGYTTCNGACGLMAVACGLQCQWIACLCLICLLTDRDTGVLAAIERTRIRKAFSLEGSIGSDCLTSLCCCCCVLMQNEREVRDREESIRRYAGPARGPGTEAYLVPGTMVYAPPPR